MSGAYGSVWEVNLSTMSPARLVDLGAALGVSPAFQAMDITMTPGGTAYILVYNMNWPTTDARIYKVSVNDLATGSMGTHLPAIASTQGSSWLVLWDEVDATLWVGAGNDIEARDADGKIVKTFTPAELGDNAYSIALIGSSSDSGDSDDGGDSGDSGNSVGNNSGGCDAGFGLLALFAIAFVVLTRRRNRE